MFAPQPCAASFDVVAETSPFGGGAIVAKQLEEQLAKIALPGKVVALWLVDKKPNVPLDDWQSSGASTFGKNEVRSQHVVDADGQALLFLDIETWAPGQAEPDCQSSAGCSMWGRCTGREGVCVAATDADCAPSTECTSDGKCVAREGECKIGDDAACRGRKSWLPPERRVRARRRQLRAQGCRGLRGVRRVQLLGQVRPGRRRVPAHEGRALPRLQVLPDEQHVRARLDAVQGAVGRRSVARGSPSAEHARRRSTHARPPTIQGRSQQVG